MTFKNYFKRFCKKIFLIKAKTKKIFLYWVSQKCCQRVKGKKQLKRYFCHKYVDVNIEGIQATQRKVLCIKQNNRYNMLC